MFKSYLHNFFKKGVAIMLFMALTGNLFPAFAVSPTPIDARALYIKDVELTGDSGSFSLYMNIPDGEEIGWIESDYMSYVFNDLEITESDLSIVNSVVNTWTNQSELSLFTIPDKNVGMINLKYGRASIAWESPLVGDGTIKEILKVNFTLKPGASLPSAITLYPDSIVIKNQDGISVTNSYTIYGTAEVIDITPPSLSFNDDVETGPVQSDTVEIDYDGATISKYKLVDSTEECDDISDYDSGSFSDYTIPLEYNNEDDNWKYICAYGEDVSGNKSILISSNSLNIDITPPSLSFNDDVETGPVQSDTVEIDYDGATISKYKLVDSIDNCDEVADYDSGSFSDYTTSLVFNTEDDNGKYICAYGEDVSGNKSILISSNSLNIDAIDVVLNLFSTGVTPSVSQALFAEQGEFDNNTNTGFFYISMKIPNGEEVNKIKLWGIGFNSNQLEIDGLATPVEVINPIVQSWTNRSEYNIFSYEGTGIIWLTYYRASIIPAEVALVGDGTIKKIFKINYELKSGQVLPSLVDLEKVVDSIYLEGDELSGEVTDLYTIDNEFEINEFGIKDDFPLFWLLGEVVINNVYVSDVFNFNLLVSGLTGSPVTYQWQAKTGSGVGIVYEDVAVGTADIESVVTTDSGSINVKFAESGKHYLKAEANDTIQTVTSDDILLNIKPVTPVSSAGTEILTGAETYSLTIEGEDGANLLINTVDQGVISGWFKTVVLNSLSEGNNIVDVQLLKGGVYSDVLEVTITVDGQGPVVSIVNPDTSVALSKTVTATISEGTLTMKELASVSDACDGDTGYVAYAPTVFTTEADNGKAVCYRGEDTVGNITYNKSVAIAGIDTTAVVISFTEGVAVWPVQLDTVVIDFSDAVIKKYTLVSGITDCDNISDYGDGSSFTDYTWNLNFSSENDNGKYVCAYGEDEAGNKSILVFNTPLNIDVTPPANASIVIDSGAVITTNANVSIVTYAEDNNTVEGVKFNCNDWVWSSEFSYSKDSYNLITDLGCTATNELKTIKAKMKDNAGNWSGDLDIAMSSIIYDTSGMITLTKIDNDTMAPYWDNNDDNSTKIYLDYNNGVAFNVCKWGTSNVDFVSLTDICDLSWATAVCDFGNLVSKVSYTRYYACQDVNGNITPTVQIDFGVDHLVPILESKTIFNGWKSVTQLSEFIFKDYNSGFIGGDTESVVSCNITTEGENKTCSITPNICDLAGNCYTTQVTSNEVDIDFTAPTSNTISIVEDYTKNNSVSLNLSSTDDLSGVTNMQFRCSESASWSSAESFVVTKLFNSGDYVGNDCTFIEGLNTIKVRYQNGAGLWSNEEEDTFYYDITAPTGTVSINDGEVSTNTGAVVLTLLADATVVGEDGKDPEFMQFSCDNNNWSSWVSFNTSHNFDLTLDSGCNTNNGEKTVFVKLKDQATNESSLISDTIIFDNQTTVSIMSISEDESAPYWDNTNNNNTFLEIWLTEEMACRWSDSSVAFDLMSNNCILDLDNNKSVCNLGDLSEQAGYIYYYACQDTSQNVTSIQSVNFGVDLTAPYLASKTEFSDIWYNVNQVSTFMFNDSLSGISSYSGSQTCTISTEGKDQICSVTPTVCDVAGNCNDNSFDSNSIDLDKTIPTTNTITIVEGDYINETGITLNLSSEDELSGNGQYRLSCNDSNWTDWELYTTADIDFDLATNGAVGCDNSVGNKDIFVIFKDIAGNNSVATSASTYYDNIAPMATLEINSGDLKTADSVVQLDLTAVDNESGLQKLSFSCDNINWSTEEFYSGNLYSFDITTGAGCNMTNETKEVFVKLIDNSNNENTTTISDTITYDTDVDVLITSIASDVVSPYWDKDDDNTTTMILTSEEEMVCRFGDSYAVYDNLPEACVSSSGGTINSCDFGSLTESYSEGGHSYVRFYACKDSLENKTDTEIVIFNLDFTAPILSSQTIFNGWYNTDQVSEFIYTDSNSGMLDSNENSCIISTEGENQSCSTCGNVCDRAGNCNTDLVTSNFVNIDKTAPVANSIKINDDDEITNDPLLNLSLDLHSEDPYTSVDKVKFSCNNSDWSTEKNYQATMSFDLGASENLDLGCTTDLGTKVIYAKFRDTVSNWSNAVSDQITFESGIPSIENSTIGGTYQWFQTVVLTSSNNDGENILYSVNDGDYLVYSGSIVVKYSQNLKYKTINQFETDSIIYNQDYVINVNGLYNMELVEKSDMGTEVSGSISFVVKDVSDNILTSGVMTEGEINLNSSNNLKIGEDYILSLMSNDGQYFNRNFTFKVDYLSASSTELKTFLKSESTYIQIDDIWLLKKIWFRVVSYGEEGNLSGVTVEFGTGTLITDVDGVFEPLLIEAGVNYDIHISQTWYFDLDGVMTFNLNRSVNSFVLKNINGKSFSVGDYQDKTFYLVKKWDVDRNGIIELADVEEAFNKIIQGIDNVESYISDSDNSGLVEMDDVESVYDDTE